MSKQFGIFGIAVVLLGGAVFMFRSGMPVGNVATTAETRNLWAGSCYSEELKRRNVCDKSCGGTSSVYNYTTTQSGNHLESTGECVTGGSCVYDMVGSDGCGGNNHSE